MRICEITDAQGQLELLRTIIDTTWSSIAQQAEQEKQAEAARKAQAKLKPRAKKRSKGGSIRRPSPPTPAPKIPNANAKPQASSASNQTTQANPNAVGQQPVAYPKPYAIPTITATNPKPATTPYPNATPISSTKPSLGLKMGYFDKNIGTTEKEDDGDDRHSKNGIATLKKLPRNFQHPST
jgi:hypothetical protein